MSNDSNSTNSVSYSSSNNDQSLRLSTDSNDNNQQQSNQTANINQTNSGYFTRSKKANLLFSVSRIENHLRQGRYAERINSTASVYLASVLEYLVAEIIELAGDKTHESKRKRITPRDIALVIKNDDELSRLCSGVTIPEGGVLPHIHQILLKSNQRRRKRRVTFSQDIEYSSSKKMKTTHNQSTKNDSVNTDTDDDLSSNSSDVDDSGLQMD